MVKPASSSTDGRGSSGASTIDVDPYSTEVLTEPYPFHHELREAGPVVWLEPYGLWATGRCEQVRRILIDWETFGSGAGVGVSDLRVEDSWRTPGLLLEADPPEHTVMRAVVDRVLSATAVKVLRDTLEAKANTLVDCLVEGASLDAITQFAEAFPVQAFADAVGIPEDGRENLLVWGGMIFNRFGPCNELFARRWEDPGRVPRSFDAHS